MIKRKKGFTLVELLIVMAIVAILALIGGAAYQSSMKRGRNARRSSDIQQIRTALEMYRADNGYYPGDAGTCDSSRGAGAAACSTMSDNNWNTSTVNGMARSLVAGQYISSNNLKADPMNNATYFYEYQSLTSGGAACATPATNCMRYNILYNEEPLVGLTPTPMVVNNP